MEADRPTHKETVIGLRKNEPTRLERSCDNGATWEVLPDQDKGEYNKGCYIEADPQRGTALYRSLYTDGTYSEIVTVHYYDEVPTTIVTSPETVTKTVDETVTLTTDVTDDGYSYQWNLNGEPIAGATSHDYTIAKVKAAHAGSYTCTVTNPVSSTTSHPTILTVNRCPQVITFPEIAAKTYGDPDFLLPRKTDKGLTIVYQSSNQAVATVSGNSVHIVAPGETNIVATQAGTADYLEAAYVSRKLTVNKRAQTITFPAPEARTYGDLPFKLPETTDEGLTISYKVINTQVARANGNTITILNAGTTEIVATQEGDATRYAAAPVTRTLTVGKASQTITFPPFAPKVYGDAPVTLNEVTDKNLTISYSVEGEAATVDGNVLTIVKPGTATVTATQEGTGNYLPATSISQALIVAKATQTIVWADIPNMTYGDTPLALPATSDKGLALTYSSSDETVARIEGTSLVVTGAGTAQITATQEGNEYYNAAASVTLTVNVAKAYQTITFDELPEVTYGTAPFALTATANASGEVRYESSNTKVATVEGNMLTVVGAGSCHITAYASGDANYYDATPVSRELKVLKGSQTIDFASIADMTYGDAPFTLNASSSTGKAVTYRSSDAKVVSINGSLATVRGAGTAVLTATQVGDENYNPESMTVTVTVNKASLIARADDKERVYGDENPELTVSYTGFVNGDGVGELATPPTASCAATVLSNNGRYDIVLSEVTDRNYSIIYQKGTLTIVKAPLTFTAHDKRRAYGDSNPELTYSISGFKNADNERDLLAQPVLTTDAKSTSPVGTYAIMIEGAEARNYDPVYAGGTLTVEKVGLTATLHDRTREYGLENEYEITYRGFRCGDNESAITTAPSVRTVADAGSDTGRYPMTLAGGSADNYYFNYAYPNRDDNAVLTVTKAPLTITADDQEIEAGASQPRLTMTFNGFRNGDTEDCLDRFPYISIPDFDSNYPGEYPIVLEGGYDNNYDFTLVNGTLIVKPMSGLHSVTADGISLSVENGTLKVYGVKEGQTLRVFDLRGALMYSSEGGEDTIYYTPALGGVYIVTVGRASAKVRI